MSSPLASQFKGKIGFTYRDSEPWWPEEQADPTGLPNVVIVIIDDLGFSSLGCFGSEISTPNFDKLAQAGLTYSNFHTTSLCSPTRASLLTGRNHHSVGMSITSNVDSGFPSKRGSITPHAATIAEVLRGTGYATYAVGKWHLAPSDQCTAVGPFTSWPLARGFDGHYGFLDALTDQFLPELVHDNHQIDPPKTPEEGYIFNEDMVDHAIEYVTNHVSIAPERPFFLYVAPGATHSPHQAPDEYLAKWKGKYAEGWDSIRDKRLARQKDLGLMPSDAQLAPLNPGVLPWSELSDEQQTLYQRFQEAYAAHLEHTDAEIGRLLEKLEELGAAENTIVVVLGDNGASQEGQFDGSTSTTFYENVQTDPFDYNMERIDKIGTKYVHNNYPLGWAQAANTPFKRYKQNTHAGGIRDPLIISWPEGISARGAVRNQFHHVTDIAPTILEIAGVEPPQVIAGVEQMPIHGTSMRYTFEQDGPTRKDRQYFEMFGHRAIWEKGWKAVSYHVRDVDYEDDTWELYHVDEDPSELNDLSSSNPEKLAQLIETWKEEAVKYDVLPLDDRNFAERRAKSRVRRNSPRTKRKFVYYGGMGHLGSGAVPFVFNRSYSITAQVELSRDGQGVVVACGGVCGGYSLYVKDHKLVHDYNFYEEIYRVEAPLPDGAGAMEFRYEFEKTGEYKGIGRLFVNGVALGQAELPETYKYFMDWEGLDIGRDSLSPVSSAYGFTAFPFTGVIKTVTFDVADDATAPDDYEPVD